MLSYMKMVNFRNYQNAELYFNEGNHFFVGPNGEGKSNFLEAVYYLGTGNSFRFSKEEDMILWGKPFFFLRGNITDNEDKITLETGYEEAKKRKVVKANNNKKKTEQLLELFPIIYFVPDDLSLVKGSPLQRRRFLDTEIYRINPLYREDLKNYNKVLLQRNRLLKNMSKGGPYNKEELSSWTEQLVHFGSRLLLQRIRTVEKLNLLARLAYRSIAANSREELSLFYSSSLAPGYNLSRADFSQLKELFQKKLHQGYKDEKRRGTTLTGPHRDDMLIIMSKREARRFSSQGQQRTIVLALKIAEIELFRSEKNKEPLLLLDDVCSELDKNRIELFFDCCSSLKQVFITTTDTSLLPSKVLKKKNNRIFFIKGGQIISSHGENPSYPK